MHFTSKEIQNILQNGTGTYQYIPFSFLLPAKILIHDKLLHTHSVDINK